MLAGDLLAVVVEEQVAGGADEVIRATVAQLAQVLGKICPFVALELWPVKRGEFPAHAGG